MTELGERPGGPRALLADRDYLRLWLVGGFANAVRWLELLAAGVFAYDQTGSGLVVAAMTAARMLPMLLIGRQLMRVALHQLRIRGHLGQRVVVAGGPAQVDEVTGVLFREKWLGYHVIGALVPPEDMAGSTPRGLPILGSTARTAAIVRDTGADIVLFAGGAVSSAQQMRRVAWDLEDTDVQIMLTPSLTDVANDRVRLRPAAGLQLMELESPRVHAAAHFSKRDL